MNLNKQESQIKSDSDKKLIEDVAWMRGKLSDLKEPARSRAEAAIADLKASGVSCGIYFVVKEVTCTKLTAR